MGPSKKRYIGVLTPKPQNVTLFGERILTEAIDLKEVSRVDCDPICVLIKRENLGTETHAHGEDDVKIQGEQHL